MSWQYSCRMPDINVWINAQQPWSSAPKLVLGVEQLQFTARHGWRLYVRSLSLSILTLQRRRRKLNHRD